MSTRIITIFLLFTAALLPAGWLVPEAEVRLRGEFPPYGRQFAVPMPDGVEVSSCLAYDGQGTPLPASVVPGVGIRLDLSNLTKKRRTGGFTLYLCKARHPKELPCKNASTVKASMVKRPVTTRAFTAREIMRHFGMLKSTVSAEAHAAYVTKLGELPQTEYWKFSESAHACHAIRWETLMATEAGETLAFGTRQPNTAWAILVDGTPVADWCSAERKEGLCLGAPVELPPGLHAVQLLALLRPHEATPEGILHRGGKAEPITGDAELSLLPGFTLERQKGSGEEASFFYHADASVEFTATGESFCRATARIKGGRFLDAEGGALACEGDSLRHAGGLMPGMELGSWRFPALRIFQPCSPLYLRLRIAESPLVVPRHGALELTLSLDAPEEGVPLLSQATLALRMGADEQRIAVEGRRAIPVRLASLPGEAESLVWQAFIFGAAATPPVRLPLIRPAMAHLALAASGNGLYNEGGERVVLVCDGIKPAATAAVTGSGTALFDAFTGEAGLEERVKRLLPQLELKGSVSCDARPGCTHTAALLSCLHRLLATGAGRALILNGLPVLKEQGEPLQSATMMLYIIQACQAKGMEPVVVCMPQLPGVDESQARLDALYTKELCLARGVPVLDLYSVQRSRLFDAAGWYRERSLSTAAPNDSAREWLTGQIAAFLQQRPTLHE